MKTPLRGELTKSTETDRKYEFTNNQMVLGVADYLNVTNDEEIQLIKNSISPVLLNSVANSVSDRVKLRRVSTVTLCLTKLRAIWSY